MYYRSREIMITIISFSSKLSRQIDIEEMNTHIVLGDSKWEQFELLEDISENKELILLIEAILINYFKPKYNEQYKDILQIGNKVYQKFENQDINPVSIELDLNIECGKMQLCTDEIRTNTKMHNIFCYKEENKIKLEGEELPDVIYDWL